MSWQEGSRSEYGFMSNTVLCIVNKEWEAEAVVAAVMCCASRPSMMHVTGIRRASLSRKERQRRVTRPRLSVRVATMKATVWCLDDIIPTQQDSSSTEAKTAALRALLDFHGGSEVIVGLGTAGWPADVGHAGSVVVGARHVVCEVIRRESECEVREVAAGEDRLGKRMRAALTALNNDQQVCRGFLVPPNAHAGYEKCYAAAENRVLSIVKLDRWEEYALVEPDAIAYLLKRGIEVSCVDTTLGVIGMRVNLSHDSAAPR